MLVRKQITVQASQERAFAVFTERQGSWWPPEHHIGEQPMQEPVVEPREGGRWFERSEDGSECDWGRVRLWDAPQRLVFTWQINGAFQFDPDPEHASEIDVRFRAEGPAETTVEVEHSGFEKVVGGQTIHDTINGGGGWTLLLDTFAKTVA